MLHIPEKTRFFALPALFLLALLLPLPAHAMETVNCGPTQYVATDAHGMHCEDMPICEKNETKVFQNGKLNCLKRPDCPKGTGMVYNGTTFRCDPTPDTCPTGTAPLFKNGRTSCETIPECNPPENLHGTVKVRMMYINGQFKCMRIPDCGPGTSIFFDGQAFTCRDTGVDCGEGTYAAPNGTCTQLPTCQLHEEMRLIGGYYRCLYVPTCAPGTGLYFDGNAYTCRPN